jgi:GMP synthase-like glutamine amidotransferase
MILLLSTCEQRLSEEEFVRPLEKALSSARLNFQTKHYLEDFDPKAYESVIICGTALKDFGYLKGIDRFSWIKDYKGKVLGICSGAQIIACVFGMGLRNKIMIGERKVAIKTKNKIAYGTFKSYFLISKVPVLKNGFLSLTKDESLIKKADREVYGLLFHPEVLNADIIARFCGT